MPVYQRTVTHLSNNPARRRVTSLMRPRTIPVPLSQTEIQGGNSVAASKKPNNLPIRQRLQSTDMQAEQLPKEIRYKFRRAMLFIEHSVSICSCCRRNCRRSNSLVTLIEAIKSAASTPVKAAIHCGAHRGGVGL